MSAPQLKLTYFGFPGRAELARLLFAYGDIAFEDKRVASVDMPALKPTLPLGQLPTLEVNGTTYSQSMAIARYAAKLSGLYPQDAELSLRADMVCETVIDLLFEYYTEIVYSDKGDDVKAEKTKLFIHESLPKAFGVIERLFLGKFVTGDAASIADVMLFDFFERYVKEVAPAFSMTEYPKIASAIEGVKANANVAAYLAKQHK